MLSLRSVLWELRTNTLTLWHRRRFGTSVSASTKQLKFNFHLAGSVMCPIRHTYTRGRLRAPRARSISTYISLLIGTLLNTRRKAHRVIAQRSSAQKLGQKRGSKIGESASICNGICVYLEIASAAFPAYSTPIREPFGVIKKWPSFFSGTVKQLVSSCRFSWLCVYCNCDLILWYQYQNLLHVVFG